MNSENRSEYETIRDELKNIKNCMTTYIGFVLGGTGAAFFGLFALSNTSFSELSLSYAPLLISLVVLMVFLIILYKFNSHNRYAGYCKLLGYEDIPANTISVGSNIFAWEICMGGMRGSDQDNDYLIKFSKDLKFQKNTIAAEDIVFLQKAYTGPTPILDYHKYRKGWKILLKAFIGNLKNRSWRFPAYVTYIFFMISFIYFSIGMFFNFKLFFVYKYGIIENFFLGASTILLSFCIIYLWVVSAGKLYTLMEGSATVDKFCWKYLPFRVRFLNQKKICPNYLLAKLVETRKDEITTFLKENNLEGKYKEFFKS